MSLETLELVGRKLGMTQIFKEDGECVGVTVLNIGPCVVVQKKTAKTDGYSAVQLGFEARKEKHVTSARKGHFAKAGVAPTKVLFEVRLPEAEVEALEVGQKLDASAGFDGVKKVDVIGVTKGRGFTGGIKRWNMHMAKYTHGTHEVFRHTGSAGSGTWPGRTIKGIRSAGHYGVEQVTTVGLSLEKIDAENNLVYVRGSVPGPKSGLVRIRRSTRS
jgi:large subunit ribosomal protein L3